MNSTAGKRSYDPKGISITLAIILLLIIPTRLFAADFTATALGDYGNVTVMEVSGNYDADKPDGTTNAVPRQVLANEFFKTHTDEYDFLVFFSNFDFTMPDDGKARGFYSTVKNDTYGLGIDRIDNTSFYGSKSIDGSSGRLQGTIDMGNLSKLVSDPLDPKFEDTLYVLSHEIMHRWTAKAKFRDSSGSSSSSLLGKDGSHWSFLLDSGGSLMYGNSWQDNGNGTFTSLMPQSEQKFYSPLDLYLMGMIDKSRVPPMLLIDSPGVDATQLPQAGVTIAGTARTVTIDDIIADTTMGPRIPDAASAQKSFKTAFIYVTQPGSFNSDDLYLIENVRNGAVTRFSILTDGNAIMQVASTPKEDIASNPGALPPSTTPRTNLPNIDEGVQWLMAAQQADGSWVDLAQTMERDTAETTHVLRSFATATGNYQKALQWLGDTQSVNLDYLARKIQALAGAGQEVASLVQDMLSQQNADGGWGSGEAYESGNADTALVLLTLSATGYSDQTVLSQAINYLTSRQNEDGGWGSEDKGGMVQETSNVLSAFNKYQQAALGYQLSDSIARGTTWLIGKQNTAENGADTQDGGFGNSPSTVYDTAVATMTLRELNVSTDITNKALAYLLGQQSENGSWNNSAYQTALAVNAVYKATVDPDLAVTSDDITIIPGTITSLPSNIVINANINNLGQTSAQAKVILYKGSIAEQNKLGEQTLSFPGQASTTVTFSAVAQDGSEHRFYIVVDPDGLVKESNELNNTAVKILSPEATYDLEVLSGDVTVTPGTADMLQDVKITAKLSNKGTMTAYNAHVKYFIDESGVPFELATQTVDVPSGSSITNEITWRANKAGTNMRLVVQIDPFETELSETNNKAETTITVNADTRPNLAVSYKDMVITPSPGNERGTVTISVLVKNDGSSPANNIAVRFYRDIPCSNTELAVTTGNYCAQALQLGTQQTIATLGPGENSRVSVDWADIAESGQKLIYVEAYTETAISEIVDTDNYAFVDTLTVRSLPDLAVTDNSIAFSPAAPKEGDPVAITVTVQNRGEQTASDVVVRLSEGNVTLGNDQTLPSLAGGNTATVSFSYEAAVKGAHTISAVMDPDNAVTEQSKDNNSASRILGVQDSSLWVTEQYLSPNGDGVKDSTQLFFRLEAARTVFINVVNKDNETVRTFNGSELANISSGSITWDGVNDSGTVVDDGMYQMQLRDAAAVIGSLGVTVDTDRSPLSDAFGTKYLVNFNLTANLPSLNTDSWNWLPDESGIVFSTSRGSGEYTPGLYTMSPDGGDIAQLFPYDWSDNNPDYQYYEIQHRLSPDGEKIAFTFWVYDKKAGTSGTELWVVDVDGSHPTQLEKSDTTYFTENIKWSPDNKNIAYINWRYSSYNNNGREIWVVNIDSREKNKIDTCYPYSNAYYFNYEWSPDGGTLAYIVTMNYSNWSFYDELRKSDKEGNKTTLFTYDYTADKEMYWLGDQKIVSLDYGSLRLHEANVSDGVTTLSENVGELEISPDGKYVAYAESDQDMVSVKIVDQLVSESVVYQAPYVSMGWGEGSIGNLSNIVWSHDGRKIAFIDRAYKEIDACIYKPHLITADADTKKTNALNIFDSEVEFKYIYSDYVDDPSCADPHKYQLYHIGGVTVWLRDNKHLLIGAENIAVDESFYFDINSETGDRGSNLPIGVNAYVVAVSPKGKYINYYQRDADWTENLWSLGSLLNLTADLRTSKEKSAIILKGIAADLNFESYQLDYADSKYPDIWALVQPLSSVPVLDDVFTTWVPPYEGSFYVRLTVWDKAGNTAASKKRVSWGQYSSITNLYKSLEIFSPNGDDVKDTVELHYRALEPVHLEFNIYDEADNLVKTYYKDHAAPAVDFMQWDGTDQSFNTVPDGKYTIKVFDYEFFVEVDGTPPDVGISFNGIEQDFDVHTLQGTLKLYANLQGHAVDKNLKSWLLEYGEGDNPQEWIEYSKGASQFAGKDNDGNTIVSPPQDVSIKRFEEEEVAWLAHKKLKITVEDYAGNKTTTVTDFIEEKLLIHKHQWFDTLGKDQFGFFVLSLPDANYSEIQLPGPHVLGGLDTIRSPIASMKVQYMSSHDWIDGETVINSSSDVINLAWDNSHLSNGIFAMRVKAVDTLGQEFYSNQIHFSPKVDFQLDLCFPPLLAWYELSEELNLLKLQIKSSQDTKYTQWTDFKIFDAKKGDVIPISDKIFIEPLLPELQTNATYTIRMLGYGINGGEYETAEKYPQTCNEPALLLKVKYSETDCGVVSNNTALSVELTKFGYATLSTLSYYIQKPEGLQLLRQFDNPMEGFGGVAVDTSSFPEGDFSAKAVLSYLDLKDNTTKELSALNTLTVDRVLPAAQITYPTKSSMLCPVKNTDAKGDWYGLPIEGIATDNNGVQYYELYYGVGENPAVWLPAMTRSNGKRVAIKETKTVQGQLGVWDVTDLPGTTYSLKLKVVDVAGNVSCYTTSFFIDTLAEIASLSTDKKLISPINSDAAWNAVTANFQIEEYAVVDAKVFNLVTTSSGYVLDTVPVRTIESGRQHPGGTGSVDWDGKTDSGSVVFPDGKYGVVVYATDSCGNTAQKWVAVEVDTAPPTLAITYPGVESTLGSLIVEVKGTADDPHFQNYTLWMGQEEVNPTEWTEISSGTLLVKDAILGKWNTSGLTGRWTLRLTAADSVGNKSEIKVPVTLVAPAALIKNYEVTPGLISPNNNGTLETTDITYELSEAADIKIEMADSSNTMKYLHADTKPSAGTYTYNYGGQSDPSGVLPDGVYTVSLIATSSTSSQREAITLTVDTTLPTVDMTSPKDKSFLDVTDLAVIGTVSDANMSEYSLSYAGTAGSTLIDQGSQSRTGYTFGSLNAISEGDYTLTVRAKDLGENEINKTTAFTIDRTPPVVKLDTPKEGEYYGGASATLSSQPSASIAITGSLVEANLETFSLRYGLGDAPAQWTELVTGTTVTAYPSSSVWSAGSGSVNDGVYTLSLYAKDKAGLSGEQKVKVTIDNTVPTSAITSLHDGDYVKQAVEVKGTAYDLNFDKYVIEISEGQCSSAFKWAVIKTGTTAVQDNVLTTWQALPLDGDYCLRVTTTDKVGLTSEAKVYVRVDTHPPVVPVLSGKVDTKTNARLDWTGNTEPDLAGYNLYRNGTKVNEELVAGCELRDQNLSEGVYIYTVKAVDLAGNESSASNEVQLKIDLTGPEARIKSPQDSGTVSGLIDIKGTAYSADDFKQYRVSIGQGASPSSWTVIRTSPLPTSYGVLAQWDTFALAEGQVYSIKLEAEDLSGNITTHQISVTSDNTAPAAPGLVSAVTSTNSSEVALTWLANSETDLAGYLLYRNDQLANGSGIVVGDLEPYLISVLTTTYLDKSLSDGTFKYYLIAMDEAGNTSDLSSTLTVTIDTRPPHAAIIDPADKTIIGGKIMVKAESPDLDLASVQFQYQSMLSSPTNTTDWLNLGSLVTTAPSITYMDPSTSASGLKLAYGDYRLRAVATDKGEKTDPGPEFITITYADLTSPTAQTGLSVLVNGDTVDLTWTPDTDADSDLAGYNIYRTAEGVRVKVNTALVAAVPLPTFQDSGLADGSYIYDVTAVDTHANESKPSNSAPATVYAPVIMQPYTPVGQGTIQVSGKNVAANASVSMFAVADSGLIPLGTATADASGVFTANAALTLGENRITARATDSAGNISKDSVVVIVIYNDPPGVPSGLSAPVQDHDVHLAWNQNPEADILGYNLYRDGVKLNIADTVSPLDVTASSSFDLYNIYPWAPVENDQSCYWMPQDGTSAANPAWWEMDLERPELISHLEIHWGTELDGSGTEVTYAGKDFEVQVWSADANAWITQANVIGNAVKDNVFDFNPAYRTDKIRIFITDSTDVNSAKQVRLAEVNILKDNVVQTAPPSYDDLNLLNNQYEYTVTAVDNYGFESLPTSTVIGDVNVALPSTPVLTASVMNSDVTLTWTASPEAETAGYTIYKSTSLGWSKIGTVLVPETAFVDANLANGTYTYRVTAGDAVGNESQPSEPATATVAVAPPAQAASLTISSTGDGSLNASWVYNGATAAGFNLYRSETTGGPYSKVANTLISDTSYLDTGLTAGVTYFYVVAAVDGAGNEGTYSNEASGTPWKSYSRPELFYPTVPGVPVTVYESVTDIAGTADPGTTVELTGNGSSIGSAAALPSDNVRSYPISYDGYGAALSPDGKLLAYTDTGIVRIMSFESGESLQSFEAYECDTLSWSPDSRKLAFNRYDENNLSQISIYTPANGNFAALTDEVDTDDYDPSWSSDGNKVAFVRFQGDSSGIWIKDLASGGLSHVVHTANAWYPRLLPDGKTMAYTDGSGLYLLDLNTAVSSQIATDAGWIALSPDGKSIAYAKYENDYSDVVVHDLVGSTKTVLTNSNGYAYDLSWTNGGRNLVFGFWEIATGADGVWLADVRNGTAVERIMPDIQNIWDAGSSLAGPILVISGNDTEQTVYTLDRAGSFRFSGVALTPGENSFTAIAGDSSGSSSETSDPVVINFDATRLADIAVTTDDVYLYPPYPIAGEKMSVNIAVKNAGGTDASDVVVDVYIWNAHNELELLKSETIPAMAAGDSALVNTIWDSAGMTGDNKLIVVVDSEDKIAEADEANNMAIKDFYVADHIGMSMSTALDAAQYSSSRNANISVTIRNTGPAANAVLDVHIEDAGGYPVVSFDSQAMNAAYANEVTQNHVWNTGSTYAGSYVVHSLLKDTAGATLAENTTPFTIISDAAAELIVVTDKAAYDPGENVVTSFTIKSTGTNTSIPALQATVSITDALGTVLFNEIKTASNLLPGTTVDLSSRWNAGLTMPGDYNAVVQMSFDGGATVTKSAAFKINTLVLLSGAITAAPSVVPLGNTAQVTYTLANTGNAEALGYTAKISIFDPETQTVMQTHEELVDLVQNGSTSGQVFVSTNGYGLKTYTAVLQAISPAGTETIGSASFTVKDLTPPVVTILSPVEGNSYGSTITILTSVTDNASGVDTVEYRRDSGAWGLLPVSDPALGRFGATWDPTMEDNGAHSVSFRATDKEGNTSEPVTVSYDVQINRAPTTPSPAAPADGADVGTSLPELILNNASDPNNDPLTYAFEVYADADLTVEITSAEGIAEGTGTTSWQTPQELTENARYFWRARAFDGKLYGDWMSTAAFRVNAVEDPPSAPVPTSPDDGTEVATRTPALTVINAVDPDSASLTYNFEVALDPEFVTIVTSTVGVSAGQGTTSWQVPAQLEEDGQYYWRAQADDWAVPGPWSAPVSFIVNTLNNEPTVPAVIAPEDGDEVATLSPDIVLQNSIDLDSEVITYSIELDTVMTFDSPNVRRIAGLPQGEGTTRWHVDGLLDNTDYFVRAKASDGAAESDWSGVSGFFVNAANNAPEKPVPSNPSDGSGVNVFMPTLSVQNATDLDRDSLTYDFAVYEDAALSKLVASVTGVAEMPGTTSWTVSGALKENSTYYWQAQAYDGELPSGWTAPFSFTVNTGDEEPTAPTIVSPAEGSSVDTLTPTLTVLNAIDPEGGRLTYEFQVFYESAMIWSAAGIAEGTERTSATLSADLMDNTVYSWRCRANDGTRDGAWTAMTKFTVHLPQTGITVDIEFEPETLHQKSKGNWVMVEIELPHGYSASDVDISSIRLEGTIPAVAWPHENNKHHHDHGCEHEHGEHDHSELKVKFRRSDAIAILPEGNHVPVHITGTVAGTPFEGVDIIRVTH